MLLKDLNVSSGISGGGGLGGYLVFVSGIWNAWINSAEGIAYFLAHRCVVHMTHLSDYYCWYGMLTTRVFDTSYLAFGSDVWSRW